VYLQCYASFRGDNSHYIVTCSHSSSVVPKKSERPRQICQPYP